MLTGISWWSPRPPLGLVSTWRTQASTFSPMTKIYYRERIQSRFSKGKVQVKSGGNEVWASKSFPLESSGPHGELNTLQQLVRQNEGLTTRGTQLTQRVSGWRVECHFHRFPYIQQKNKISDSQKETNPKGLCSALTRLYNFGTEHRPYQLRWQKFQACFVNSFLRQVIVLLIIFYTFPILYSCFKEITFSSITFASSHTFALV